MQHDEQPMRDDEQATEEHSEQVPDPRMANDRPSKEGLPPDFGAEQSVMTVRPAFFRAKPMQSLGLLALPVIAAVATWFIAEQGARLRPAATAALIGAVVCWIPLLIWWFVATRGRGLEITNKRSIERRGLLSKSTDEVLHDHVRNVKVDQTFYHRVVRIGQIGVASSGSDQTEIIMEDLPNPQKIREIIDLYRPLD